MIARVASIALIVAVLTWLAGWWPVIPVALAAGWLSRANGGRASSVALGSAAGWGALLVADALQPRFLALVTVLGGIFPVPGLVLAIVTVAFAACLGWSAATAAAEVGRLTTRSRRHGVAPSGRAIV